jgi:hypothetical protein
VKLPWYNKTGIPKAIAIIATIGILTFGLCTANLFVPPANTERWQRIQALLASTYSVTVIFSIILVILLLVINAFRERD